MFNDDELQFIKYVIEFFEVNVEVNAVSPYNEKEIENYIEILKGKFAKDLSDTMEFSKTSDELDQLLS